MAATDVMNNSFVEIETLTFEQALAELEETVRQLESGDVPLEESLVLFERGQALVDWCNSQLDEAELKIHQLSRDGSSLVDTLRYAPDVTD